MLVGGMGLVVEGGWGDVPGTTPGKVLPPFSVPWLWGVRFFFFDGWQVCVKRTSVGVKSMDVADKEMGTYNGSTNWV